MTDSARETLDYRPPRWLLWSAACGCAALYGCALAAANVLPRVDQEHGWPLVYMTREWKVYGDLTVLYGPWPLDDPPLESFRPVLLAVDVVFGILLMLAAAFMAVYWLRARQRPLQFSLRALLGLTAAVPCCWALAMWLLDPSDGLWTALQLIHGSVYVGPCLLVVTTAHWMLGLRAGSWPRRRWAGIHWLTWLGLGVMAGPFLHYCLFAYTDYWHVGGKSPFDPTSYGWPLGYAAEHDGTSRPLWPMGQGLPVSFVDAVAPVADFLIALAMLAATGFVVEGWIRRAERRDPVRRTSILLAVMTVVAVACTLKIDRSYRPEWYAYPFWLFGIACTVFAGMVLSARAITRLFGKPQAF